MSSESKSATYILRQAGSYGVVVVVSVALTLLSLRLFPKVVLPTPATQDTPPAPSLPQPTTPIPETPNNFVAAAVNQVGPAVVRIDTERTVETNVPTPFNEPFFRRFFGDEAFPQLPQERRQQGQGSGFIVDETGIILTNAHVVDGADQVTVTLPDGRSFQGEVKGTDSPSDLAVVKITGSDLPVAPLGNSDQSQVGDWAIAVGNPLGLDNTVTLGIISTLNRSSSQVGIPDKRLDFIQTDVAINPGNSGGPLLNQKGEVIGINTAIRAEAEGIGFAIPINQAKEIQDILARGETVPHPFIGIQMVTLTPEMAQQFNSDPNSSVILPEVDGVLIAQVVPGSPAAEGGIRRGDVITDIDGTPITSAEQLQDVVEDSRIGQALRFQVRRGEETQELEIRPAEMQDFAQ